MHSEIVPFKSKTWGVVPHPRHSGHYYTGYAGAWYNRQCPYREWSREGPASPEAAMQIGQNAIIEGRFVVVGFSRGRSAANFQGYFEGAPECEYTLSMDGVCETLLALQHGRFLIKDGMIDGRWTFSKQGANIFLCPAKPH